MDIVEILPKVGRLGSGGSGTVSFSASGFVTKEVEGGLPEYEYIITNALKGKGKIPHLPEIHEVTKGTMTMEFLPRHIQPSLGEGEANFLLAMKVAQGVASAMEQIQKATYMRFIHRDVSFENLGLDASNEVCLFDFGAAKRLGDPLDRIPQGASYILAPEIFSEDPPCATPSLDAWSVGILMYQLIFRKYHPMMPRPPEHPMKFMRLCNQIAYKPELFTGALEQDIAAIYGGEETEEVLATMQGLLDPDQASRMPLGDVLGSGVKRLKSLSHMPI